MGLHSPLPSSVECAWPWPMIVKGPPPIQALQRAGLTLVVDCAAECRKCSKILASFVNPRQAFGPDKVIPPTILSNAKGLAVITIVKAGFLGSGRVGSGVVVARLVDGTWSAPSAIILGGAGFGGQIGFELADVVFILNDAHAVKTFAQAGSLTLGGNVSLAAGPVGRNAEAAGAASLKSIAGIFSYSKTCGLFVGVSLEGSAIIERREANAQLYGTRYTAQQILTGATPPPPEAQCLMTILNSRAFSGMRAGSVAGDAMYNDRPVFADEHDDVGWEGRPKRSSTWQDDTYDRPGSFGVPSRSQTFETGDHGLGGTAPEKRMGPGRPAMPKPSYGAAQAPTNKEAVALFNFEPDQPGDLGFKKGDVITVLKKTDSDNDWWYDAERTAPSPYSLKPSRR